MSKTHSITANGVDFQARTGDVILDAALRNGVDFPHDCRAGACGSCLSRVRRGVTIGGETLQPGMVHACQARALSDIELEFSELPPVQSVRGRVSSLVARAPDVIEVGIKLVEPVAYQPGQYCNFRFRGFPARSFSPSAPADGEGSDNDITLHIKRVRDGLVSQALGHQIKIGHRLRMEGPLGAAFYRPGVGARLVLLAGGTGFAPIYAIARAALAEDPNRNIVIVVGSRTVQSLYMAPALLKLKRYPNVEVVLTAAAPTGRGPFIKAGSPADHLPPLRSDDVLYAAGAPAMIRIAAGLAVEAGADFYSDPFESSGPGGGPQWQFPRISWPALRNPLNGVTAPWAGRSSRAAS